MKKEVVNVDMHPDSTGLSFYSKLEIQAIQLA